MTNYKIKKYKGLKVFYTEELDGGGTTFGQDYLSFIPRMSKKKFGRAYEWCSGPGFIGFSLLANGLCDSLCLSDIHPPAIAAVKKTIEQNGLEGRVKVYTSDSLDEIPESEKWDLVVSNPPHYKKQPTLKGISNDWMRMVLDENLDNHKRFFNKISSHLTQDGIILLQENWHRVALDDFKELLNQNNLDFKFSSPFSNKFYYLCASFESNKISLSRPPYWTVKYTTDSLYWKIRTIVKKLVKK